MGIIFFNIFASTMTILFFLFLLGVSGLAVSELFGIPCKKTGVLEIVLITILGIAFLSLTIAVNCAIWGI